MKIVLKIMVPVLILGGAVLLGKYLISRKEDPKSRKPAVVVPSVDIVIVPLGNHKPSVMSFGTVNSYFQTSLTPQVSGEIIEVSPQFRVGKMVKEGTLLARVDDTDYQSALANQEANLALQKRTLAEEEIRAKQAAEDWLASGRKLSTASDFVLRKPQLAAAKASITSAEAAIKKATADIKRTRLVAPYDAVVTERTASLGNQASAQTSLGTLVATGRVEIRLPLTAEQVNRIDMSTKEPVVLTSPNIPDVSWSAHITRTEPTVDPRNQVTYIIAEVENPYTAESKPLSVGTFVNASIPAISIENVYKVPEAALVNDSHVWILDKENKLHRAEAERVYSYDSNTYVRIRPGEIEPPLRIVSRPLSNFRAGTLVKAGSDQKK